MNWVVEDLVLHYVEGGCVLDRVGECKDHLTCNGEGLVLEYLKKIVRGLDHVYQCKGEVCNLN